MKTTIILAFALITAAITTGCVTMHENQRRQASSLVQYLYPNDTSRTDEPQVATLTLPLRVGVAFVPEESASSHHRGQRLTEQQKIALLKQVSTNFSKYPFVKRIEIVPSAYLTPRGGFENLEQLQKMFGVDVMALVSYDQMQFTGSGKMSITYLTIIGAYLINGENNDTRTMLDTAVYDIRSRKLLFRAPGISEIKDDASLVNQEEKLRHASEQGFKIASTNLAANLESELLRFPERIKESPDEVKIARAPGYSGGAFGTIEIAALVTLVAGALAANRRRAQ